MAQPEKHCVCVRTREEEEDDWTLRAEWCGCGMLLPLRLMPCPALLLLAVAVWKVGAPPTFQRAVWVSHTRRHMGRPDVCVCLGKQSPAGDVFALADLGDLSRADFFLYSARLQLWGSRSEVVFHSGTLAHVRVAPNCIYCRVNQIWAENLLSKSTTKREFLTGIDLVSRCTVQGHKTTRSQCEASLTFFFFFLFKILHDLEWNFWHLAAYINLDTNEFICELLAKFRKTFIFCACSCLCKVTF